MKNGIYVVTGDAGDLEGWTPEELTEALTTPLRGLGIAVECKPNQSGGGGFHPSDEWCSTQTPSREEIESVVERVVVEGA